MEILLSQKQPTLSGELLFWILRLDSYTVYEEIGL